MTVDTIDLKPRAIAVLCALRSGPKTSNQLGTAIGDGPTPAGRTAIRDLLDTMSKVMDQGAGGALDPLIVLFEGRWYLDHNGLGWLEGEGLIAVKEVRIWHARTKAAERGASQEGRL